MPRLNRSASRGFTLIEAVVVIVITGIIAGIVAVFLKRPIEGYFDAVRRAELTDTADTALRRITRDLRLALPNSVRVDPSGKYLEFLLTRTGGRYRASLTSTGTGNVLDFVSGSSSFDVIGPPLAINAADRIAVFNLGIPGADAYSGDTLRPVTGGGTLTTIGISGAPFPYESPGHRFQVVETPVSYICAGGTLKRYWGYAIQALQPSDATAAPLSTASSALMANDVVGCTLSYTPGASQRFGLVTLQLSIGRAGESITLYHDAHVSNNP